MSTQHVTVELNIHDVRIRCGTAGVIDELIALDTHTDDTQSVFGYIMTSEQLNRVTAMVQELERRGVKRTADGSFPAEDRKLWTRCVDGRCLLASASAWREVTTIAKEGITSLEHVMDALGEAGFELVSSHARVTYGVDTEKYIFRRAA